jgi:hypothetical protein
MYFYGVENFLRERLSYLALSYDYGGYCYYQPWVMGIREIMCGKGIPQIMDATFSARGIRQAMYI